MISDPLALILLWIFRQLSTYLVRNYESMYVYVSTPLKMLTRSKYNFWEQNQWWGDSYSQLSFVDLYFQLKQNQIMLFWLVFVELKSRQGLSRFKQAALSIMLGMVKEFDAPESSDSYSEPCRSLSCFLILSTLSHLAVLAFSLSVVFTTDFCCIRH